jgi:hypothetical protein
MKTLDQLGTNVLQVSNLVAQVKNALQQVEPRYAISDFRTNLTLPGSYYLTANLVAGTDINDGINIRTNASHITVDLNGFSIIGTNVVDATSAVGIRISGATNIVIRNGQISAFDRAIRVEGAASGIVIEKIHAYNLRRSGIENIGVAGSPTQSTISIRDCIVESVDATGEAANAAADGIVLLNCTAVVDNCVVRDLTAAGTSVGSCLNLQSCTNSFINNNFLSGADFGLKTSGAGTRYYYRNNLTAGCVTSFSIVGAVDRGGNF